MCETEIYSMQVINDVVSTTHTTEFISENIQEAQENEKLTSKNLTHPSSRESHTNEYTRSQKILPPSKDECDEERLIKTDQHNSSCLLPENQGSAILYQNGSRELTNLPQELISPCDLSPAVQLQVPVTNERSALNNVQIVTSPRIARSRVARVSHKTPNMSSSIFAFIMTVAFVCILWLVVFIVFGYRGHAIAGVFVGLFLIGLLMNTCFLKLYFRLKVFLGLNAAINTAERRAAVAQRHRQLQIEIKFTEKKTGLSPRNTKISGSITHTDLEDKVNQEQSIFQKSREQPPSYESATALPPSYSLLQYFKQKKSTTSLMSSSSRVSIYKKGHNCPFCKREVRIFGICISCKKHLAAV